MLCKTRLRNIHALWYNFLSKVFLKYINLSFLILMHFCHSNSLYTVKVPTSDNDKHITHIYSKHLEAHKLGFRDTEQHACPRGLNAVVHESECLGLQVSLCQISSDRGVHVFCNRNICWSKEQWSKEQSLVRNTLCLSLRLVVFYQTSSFVLNIISSGAFISPQIAQILYMLS